MLIDADKIEKELNMDFNDSEDSDAIEQELKRASGAPVKSKKNKKGGDELDYEDEEEEVFSDKEQGATKLEQK
jgi:hypothetical protein